VVSYISEVVGQNTAAECLEGCISGPAVAPQDSRLEDEAASICRPGQAITAESLQAMLHPVLEEVIASLTPKVPPPPLTDSVSRIGRPLPLGQLVWLADCCHQLVSWLRL
jgi:hypothetical protein